MWRPCVVHYYDNRPDHKEHVERKAWLIETKIIHETYGDNRQNTIAYGLVAFSDGQNAGFLSTEPLEHIQLTLTAKPARLVPPSHGE